MKAVDKLGNELFVGDRVVHGARSGNSGAIQLATVEKIVLPKYRSGMVEVTIRGDGNTRSGVTRAHIDWRDDTSDNFICDTLIKLFEDYKNVTTN